MQQTSFLSVNASIGYFVGIYIMISSLFVFVNLLITCSCNPYISFLFVRVTYLYCLCVRKMPCWYFNRGELKYTPSFCNGVDACTEEKYRREGAKLIVDAGTTLGLYPIICSVCWSMLFVQIKHILNVLGWYLCLVICSQYLCFYHTWLWWYKFTRV